MKTTRVLARRLIAPALVTTCSILLIFSCSRNQGPTSPGDSSGLEAAAGLSVNLDQLANGVGSTAPAWQNGNLNGNNSAYAETRSIPYRLGIGSLPEGTHKIEINMDWTAGGHKGFDFPTSWDRTEAAAIALAGGICGTGGGANGVCLSGQLNGDSDSETWPTDNFNDPESNLTVAGAVTAQALPDAQRKLELLSANAPDVDIIAILADPVHAGCGGTVECTGNSTVNYTVIFSVDCPGPGGNPTCNVMFRWGANLASSAYWNQASATTNNGPDGANEISGAPWHMRSLNLTTGCTYNETTHQCTGGKSQGGKNQDRSIQPSALPDPGLQITKTANPAGPVNAGDVIGFDIQVTNVGGGPATNVTVVDTLPDSGLTWTETNDSKDACLINVVEIGGVNRQILSCSLASLAALDNLQVSVQAESVPAVCGTVTNRAHADADNSDPKVTSLDASVTVDCPDLAIVKTPDGGEGGEVAVGDSLRYTIIVTNNGPGVATNVVIDDTLPDGGLAWVESPDDKAECSIDANVAGAGGRDILHCDLGDLDDDESFTITVKAETSNDNCGDTENVAWVDADNDAPVSDGGSSTVVCFPDLEITKTADPAGPVSAGDSIGFTIEVKNNGPATAVNVVIDDTLPDGGLDWIVSPANADCTIDDDAGENQEDVLHCDVGDLDEGESFSVTVKAETSQVQANTVIGNTAVAGADNNDDVEDDDEVTVVFPDIEVIKEVTPDVLSFSSGSSSLSLSRGGGLTPATHEPAGAPADGTFVGLVDDQGANDQPGQKDLTRFSRSDAEAGFLWLRWNHDGTTLWTGAGSTGDGCALLDTDDDGNANYALCVQFSNDAAGTTVTINQGYPILYSCGDGKTDRCTQKISTISPIGGTLCAVNFENTDPFPAGDDSPRDVNTQCKLDKSIGALAGAALINVCSYPSGQPNSDPSDCVVTPGAGFIQIVKEADPDDGTDFTFTLSPASINGVSQFVVEGNSSSDLIPVLPASGPFSITETVPSNWQLETASCEDADGNPTGTFSSTNKRVTGIAVTIGDTVTCTFENSSQISGEVTYTIRVINHSLEPVTLDELTDDKFGDLLESGGECATLETSLATAGETGDEVQCQFTKTLTGQPGDEHINVVTATASDAAGDEDTDTDDAKVTFE